MVVDYFLKYGDIITMNKADPSFFNPVNFRSLEWFRPKDYTTKYQGYSCYGVYTASFLTNRKLHLLNLGSGEARQQILNFTSLEPIDINPDYQYEHNGNLKVHLAIEDAPFFKIYDGTIITKPLIDKNLLDYLEGPEEIVLFTNRTKNALSFLSFTKFNK